MTKRIEVKEGERYGRLTIIREVEPAIEPSGKRVRTVICKCDCGNDTIVRLHNLRHGTVKSCGCYKRYVASHRRDCHHLKNTRIYRIWSGMKRRCYNKHNEHFDRYGGRGITVCQEWKSDFMNFYDWATTHGYKDGLSIDRIDNNGNYEPSNCRWATQKQQVLNSTGIIKCSIGDTDASLTDIAEILGVSFKRIRRIVYLFEKGYSVNELLSLSKKDDSFMFADDSDTKQIEDLPKKCEFEPFQKVLVRDSKDEGWGPAFFVRMRDVDDAGYKYKCLTLKTAESCGFRQCIPYNEETKHLLGTTDEWKGDEI